MKCVMWVSPALHNCNSIVSSGIGRRHRHVGATASQQFLTVLPCCPRGTLPYMAPELVSDPMRVSEKADVWSLGMVLWEMLTLQVPFGDLTPQQIVAGLMVGNLQPPVRGDAASDCIVQSCFYHDFTMVLHRDHVDTRATNSLSRSCCATVADPGLVRVKLAEPAGGLLGGVAVCTPAPAGPGASWHVLVSQL
jgi:serine/threonine protein kinase